MNESFFYMGKTLKDKTNILKKIYKIANKLIGIIQIHDKNPITWNNSGSSVSSKQLKTILNKAGWKIKFYKINKYFEDKVSCKNN